MERPEECILMNVRVSDECRMFGGILDDWRDDQFSRGFGVLVDGETGEQLKRAGWNTRYMKTLQTNTGAYPYLFHILIDYGTIEPVVEAVTETRTVLLDEKTIGCLDSMEIEYVNLEAAGFDKYAEDGERIGRAAVLKSLKAYVKGPRLVYVVENGGS